MARAAAATVWLLVLGALAAVILFTVVRGCMGRQTMTPAAVDHFAEVRQRVVPIANPSAIEGTPEQRLARTREIRDQIEQRIASWFEDACGGRGDGR